MTTHITKTWFVDGQIIEQEIPEAAIYLQHWSIDGCKAYAVQLRDKTRANTAAHAADAIEYLLSQAPSPWVSLTDDELLKTYGWKFESYGQSDRPSSLGQSIMDEAKQEIIDGLRKVEAALKEKNI